MSKILHVLLGLAGLGLLAWMVHRTGFSTLAENLARFGFASTLFLVSYLYYHFLNVTTY